MRGLTFWLVFPTLRRKILTHFLSFRALFSWGLVFLNEQENTLAVSIKYRFRPATMHLLSTLLELFSHTTSVLWTWLRNTQGTHQ